MNLDVLTETYNMNFYLSVGGGGIYYYYTLAGVDNGLNDHTSLSSLCALLTS